MSEQEQLATAIACFRPLNAPLPPGFDVESLPVYRTPISHPAITAAAAEEPDVAAEESDVVHEPAAMPEEAETETAPIGNPIAASTTTPDQICQWAGCSKTFSGLNAPTLLWVSFHDVSRSDIPKLIHPQLHLTNEHVGRPVVDPACKWVNCSYSNEERKNLVSHVGGVHAPDYLPLVCEECGKGFKQKSHIDSHKKRCLKE
jgi:hypothetical protein